MFVASLVPLILFTLPEPFAVKTNLDELPCRTNLEELDTHTFRTLSYLPTKTTSNFQKSSSHFTPWSLHGCEDSKDGGKPGNDSNGVFALASVASR